MCQNVIVRERVSLRRLLLTIYSWEQFLSDATQYFWQQRRKCSEISTDEIKLGEAAKDEEAICQCGLKPANS